MEIFFCEKCGKRLSDLDIERGDAVAVADDEVYCKDCCPEDKRRKKGSSPGRSGVGRRSPHGTRRSPAGGFAPAKTDSRRMRARDVHAEGVERPSGGGSAKTVLTAVGVVALIVVLLYSMMLMGGGLSGRSARRAPDADGGAYAGGPEDPNSGGGSGGGDGGTGDGKTGSGGGAVDDGVEERMSLREKGARQMVADIRRRWAAGEISRLGAYQELNEFFKRYPETKAVADGRKLKAEIPEPEPGFGLWYVVSGFPYKGLEGLETVYPPEEGFDPNGTYKLPDGSEATWQSVEAPDPVLSLQQIDARAPIVFYAFGYLVSAEEQEVTVATNSDDGIKVWINDKVIVEENVERGISTDPDTKTKVKLKKGHNPVLVKITNRGGPGALKLAIEDASAEVVRTTKGPDAPRAPVTQPVD